MFHYLSHAEDCTLHHPDKLHTAVGSLQLHLQGAHLVTLPGGEGDEGHNVEGKSHEGNIDLAERVVESARYENTEKEIF